VFSIFNGSQLGWYDANPDDDIQHEVPVVGFADAFRTETVVVDMTGPDPAIDGDDKNFLNLRSQNIRTDHTDGTPIDGLYWGMHFVFQGDDFPAKAPTDQFQVVIDNMRFCSDLACTPSTTTPGDYNNNGVVDAADYVVWRATNINGQQGYDDWRMNFGSPGSGLGSGAAAVPEPASIVLALASLLICGVLMRRR
jgi:hypothetical protein